MELRPYQKDLVNEARQAIADGNKEICVVLGCGGGKSCIQATIAELAGRKGNHVLFLVHRKELCEQIRNTFAACGVDFSLCQIGMVQTVCRRLADTTPPSLILCDEAHHILSASYMKIIEYFPSAVLMGFSATPIRMNEGGLGKVFQKLIEGVSTKWLIENHYLAPYKYYGVTLADTSKLHTRNGDFDKAEVEALMGQSYIFGSAVDNWMKYANGKQTIVYCSSIATSKATVESFRARGISAMHLDAKTSQKEREGIVQGFRDGKISVLSNVDLFGEGFDVPDCEAVVLLRPTKSLSLHIQQSMRSMRYKEGKTAIILDHVGNYARHGLPDDEREWSLDGKVRKPKSINSVKECPNCFSVNPAGSKVCAECGAELTSTPTEKEKKIIEEIMLEEIKAKPYSEYMNCKTFDDLENFRKAKKFKFAWSIHKAVEMGIKVPGKYWYTAKMMGVRI